MTGKNGKKIAVLIAAAVLLASLAGCGGPSGSAPDGAARDQEALAGLPGTEGGRDGGAGVPDGWEARTPSVPDPDVPDDRDGIGQDDPDPDQGAGPEAVAGVWIAEISVSGYGVVTAELYADVAPLTVANFVDLAGSGFYDGLTFHRIIDGFMIQGGDPLGSNYGGSGRTIRGEFASNGWENNISHTRGTISMARGASDPDGASSQFFIMQSDAVYLDGDYAAFGRVISGMDAVDAMCAAADPDAPNGVQAAADQPVILSVSVRPAEAAGIPEDEGVSIPEGEEAPEA